MYFINDSQDVLDYIKIEPAGYMTADDDVLTLDAKGTIYHDDYCLKQVKNVRFANYGLVWYNIPGNGWPRVRKWMA